MENLPWDKCNQSLKFALKTWRQSFKGGDLIQEIPSAGCD